MSGFNEVQFKRIGYRWNLLWAFSALLFFMTEAAIWAFTGHGSNYTELIFAASFIVVVMTYLLVRCSDAYLSRRKVLAAARKDTRPYFLLLRSFSDRALSDIDIGNTVTVEGACHRHPTFTLVEHVDSIISLFAKAALPIGRVVIIGSHVVPWPQTLRCECLQILTSDQAWQGAFEHFASRARVLVFVFGDTPSVRHELAFALNHYRDRLYVLVPPVVHRSYSADGLLHKGRVSWDEHRGDSEKKRDSRARTLAVLKDILGIEGNTDWKDRNTGMLLHPSTNKAHLLDESSISDLRRAMDLLVVKEFCESFRTGVTLCKAISEYEESGRALKRTKTDTESNRR
ncbi:MAG: hypothetical protein ACRC1K_26250 [Planctomycetia bacterium]